MSEDLKINTRVRRLFHYIDDFERGNIQVPAFQRDHVWSSKDKIELFESIKLGYPIGSILFWRPDFKSNSEFLKFESDKIGSYFLPQRSQDYFYVLDGYQRLSTLLGCLVNSEKTNLRRDDLEWQKEFNLIYNLESDKFEFNRKTNLSELEIYKVPLYKFIDGKEFFEFQKQLLNLNLDSSIISDYIKKYENLSSKIIDYNIPSIDMIGGSIKEAIEIFSRVNSKGAKITDDWKVSALSFNKDKNFRLGTEIDNLIRDLSHYNFQSLRRELIFDCIKNSFGKAFFDQAKKSSDLEELATKPEFAEITRSTLFNIEKAVAFLFNECSVIDGKLLPYNIQLIFIADFFTKVDKPSNSHLLKLKHWFWITSYTNYFTSNLSKQRIDYYQFQRFIDNENESPLLIEQDINTLRVLEILPKINMGSVRAKSTALFMLNTIINSFHPKMNLIHGFKLYYLFDNIGEDRGVNAIENTIVLPDSPILREHFGINSKSKYLTNLLGNTFDCSPIFITKEMKSIYSNTNDKYEVLKLRRKEIIKKEENFIAQFNLDYLPF